MGKAFKILPKNYLADWGEFEDWALGTGSAPTGWLAATYPTCFRESTSIKYGDYALGMIGGSGITVSGVYRTVPDGSDYAGRTFKLGIWAKSASTGPYIELSDGVASYTVHLDGLNAYAFHTSPAVKIDYAATQIRVNLMASLGATVYFDGGVLCEGEDLFLDLSDNNIMISSWKPSMSLKLDSFEIANREGSVIPEYHFKSNQVRAAGTLVGSDVASCRNHFDGLMKAMMSWKKDEKRNIYLYDDRVLEGFLNSFNWEYVNGLQMIKFDMRFEVPDASSRYISKLRKRQVISGTTTEFYLDYNGSIEAKPVISFVADQGAAIGTCSLQNLTTDESMGFSGTVPNNAALDIDCFQASVIDSGIDKISLFSGDFLRLVPGRNNLRFYGSNCTINIDWYDRWL